MIDANFHVVNHNIPATNPVPTVPSALVAAYASAGVLTAPAATPTDLVVLNGSATKTIRVKRITVTGSATTAGSMEVLLKKHTVANTGGTKATAPDVVKLDSADGAATCVVDLYTANPTIDSTAKLMAVRALNMGVAGANGAVEFDFTNADNKGILIKGAAQALAINFNGGTVPTGGKLGWSVIWEEI